MTTPILLLVVLSFALETHSQSIAVDLDILQQHFKNFEYEQVVQLADTMLAAEGQIASKDRVSILEMKAIAHFSLFEMNASLNSFMEILKLDPGFSLDPIKTSPKIVAFFHEIKSNFQSSRAPISEKPRLMPRDTVTLVYDSGKIYRNALLRSALLPGWGQMYIGDKNKAFVLASLSVVALGSTIYYGIDCANKQEDYLNQIDKSQMDEKYTRYNQSYKIRNILIGSCTLLWIYSEIDLLFFQTESLNEKVKIGVKPSIGLCPRPTFFCSIFF